MHWTKRAEQIFAVRRAGHLACALVLSLALALGGALAPGAAFAEVRKADIVLGETVDARGLSVAQCPGVEAEYAIVMDADGKVYFERNADAPTQIASITKIMTAVVALDAVGEGVVSLDDAVTVSAAAAAVGESSAGLQEGDVMDLRTALTALLVPSGNDAAVAIAETVGAALQAAGLAEGATAQDAFVAAMNDKAVQVGCTDSVYENPHGLDFDQYAGNLHSTARDVAEVVRYAMRNETFRADVALGDTDVQVERGGESVAVHLESTDEFPFYSDYAIGVKTGFTALAGASFAGATNKDGLELYAVAINSPSEPQRFQDAAEMTDWVYEHLISYPLANSDRTATMSIDGQEREVPVAAEVACAAWIDKTVPAALADPDAEAVIFDLNGNVSQTVTFQEPAGAVRAGDVVGQIAFKQRNAIVAVVDLVACADVPAPGFFEGIGIWWDRLFRGLSGQPQTAESITLNQTPLVNDKTALAS